MKITESEILAIEESPDALRIIADWRDFQQVGADSMGTGTEADGKRADELRYEAARIEDAY
jgi:hypothetical protein